MNLPDAIRHARQELGLTQAALGRLAGIPRQRVQLLENGSNVTLNTLLRVLQQLPNLHTFTLGSIAVDVNRIQPEPWKQGAVAAAAFLAKACQHVIDRVTRGEVPAADSVGLLNEPES